MKLVTQTASMTHHTLVVLLTDGTHRVTQWFDAHPDQYSGVGGALYEATRLLPAESATYFAGIHRAQFNATQIQYAVRLYCGVTGAQEVPA